jgi:hypothetical protein
VAVVAGVELNGADLLKPRAGRAVAEAGAPGLELRRPTGLEAAGDAGVREACMAARARVPRSGGAGSAASLPAAAGPR